MICLSFDTDHIDAGRMEEFLATVPIPGAGTFFCTQVYSALADGPHETCPHPTLAPGSDWGQALDRAQREFPQATGLRAHSCVHSHELAVELGRRGYEWVSARDDATGRPAPYREAWGIWHLPIHYMDNMDFSFSRFWSDVSRSPFAPQVLTGAIEGDGLYVFDFHPIHLLLNSDSAEAYLERRDAFLDGAPTEQLRCEGRGARDFYEELCAAMEERAIESVPMTEALQAFSGR